MERPSPSEYAAYYEKYVSLVPQGLPIVEILETQAASALAELRQISEEKSLYAYAPGKWTIRESFVHVTDTERIFTYRALRIGRGDQTELPGFEQDDYIVPSAANSRSWKSILEEQEAVRNATLQLFRNLPPDAWTRTGNASRNTVSVRALAYITAGHELHHLALLRNRYLTPAAS
jgi:uncharacterized damage-inducible protein DinB